MSIRPNPASRRFIESGLVWPDGRGRPIQAHGGAVICHDGAWWWFGEDRSRDNDPAYRGVACYRSTDLVNWSFRGQVLRLAEPEVFGPARGPNVNKYLTALSLKGPWSGPHNFAPPDSHTYGSPSTNLLNLTGTKQTTVIYRGDRWNPYDLSDSHYLWHPLEIGGGRLELKPRGWMPGAWRIDVQTGEVTYA